MSRSIVVRLETLLPGKAWRWENRMRQWRRLSFRGTADTGPLPIAERTLAALRESRKEHDRFVLLTPWSLAETEASLGAARDLFDEIIETGREDWTTRLKGRGDATIPSVEWFHDAPHRFSLSAVVRALRPHQWAKNLLVAVPLLTGHQYGEPAQVFHTLMAIVAFCLVASAIYLINDLVDLPHDRRHPRKSARPLASGELSLAAGLTLAPLLMIGAAAIAWFLPLWFQVAIGLYLVTTIAYSFVLKRLVLLDVVVLAGLYTLRLIAGSFAITLPPSDWLMAFSMFIFLSLALMKRYGEVINLAHKGERSFDGRAYHPSDGPLLLGLGTSAGYLSVLVFALYVNSPTVRSLYRQPDLLWLLCPLLLYWVGRAWFLCHRGQMPDDPVLFAVKDKISLLIVSLMAVTVIAAI